MATVCPNCGSNFPKAAAVCAACGWDFAAGKQVGKPAGLDLFFKPGPEAPEPPKASPSPLPFEDAAPAVPAAAPLPPEDPFAAITRKEKPKPPPFPSNILDPLLESLQRTRTGRDALSRPRAQAVVAELRKPGVFAGTAAGLAVLAVGSLYLLLRSDAPPPPAPAPAAAAPQAYVRPAASFAGAPKAVIEAPSSAPAAAVTPSGSRRSIP